MPSSEAPNVKWPFRYHFFVATSIMYLISVVLVFQLIDRSPVYLVLLVFSVIFFAVPLFAMWARHQLGKWPNLKAQVLFTSVVDIVFFAMFVTIILHRTNFLEWFKSIPVNEKGALIFFVGSFILYHLSMRYHQLMSKLSNSKPISHGPQYTDVNVEDPHLSNEHNGRVDELQETRGRDYQTVPQITSENPESAYQNLQIEYTPAPRYNVGENAPSRQEYPNIQPYNLQATAPALYDGN